MQPPTEKIWAVLFALGAFSVSMSPVRAAPDSGPSLRVVLARGSVEAARGARRVRVEGGEPLPDGAWVRTGAEASAKLISLQGCVFRLGADTVARITGGCKKILVKKGRVEVSAPSDVQVEVTAGKGMRARVEGGVARAFVGADDSSERWRVCVLAGGVEVWASQPAKEDESAGPAAGAGGGTGGSGERSETTAQTKPKGSGWQKLEPKTCRSASGRGSDQNTEPGGGQLISELCPPETPEVELDLEPVLPKGKKKRGGSGAGGGSGSVSAGAGGSMCLDSAGSGPGASNVQQGPSSIQKPPPATHLKLRVRLPWKRQPAR
jgi:hypothetical protein